MNSMVSSDTIFIIIMEVLVMLFGSYLILREGITIYRKGKVFVKSPKLRGRNILRDERSFGSGIMSGYEMMKNGWFNIMLIGRDNRRFFQTYHQSQLYPENPVQAAAGSEPSIWRVKGLDYLDRHDDEKLVNLEKENIVLKEEHIKQDVKSKIAINEAATLPDRMEDLIKEMQKIGKQEGIKVIK